MNDYGQTVVTVRGEAATDVDPDYARIRAHLNIVGEDAAAALALVTNEQQLLLRALEALGGVPHHPEAPRRPLTYSSSSVTTTVETHFDEQARAHLPTGATEAHLLTTLTVRDRTLISDLTRTLAQQPALTIQGVSWHIDHDHPARAQTRALAVRDALRRATHYAQTLGGTLSTVLQIADIGLLDNETSTSRPATTMSRQASSSIMQTPPALELSPAPITVRAAIDTRFTATGLNVHSS